MHICCLAALPCLHYTDQIPNIFYCYSQTVEAPTLSLLVPLLVRGLAERATAIRRKTAVIIDNMAKLVDSPHDAAVFLPRLLPGLKNMSNETADPEARSVAERAHKTMVRIGAEGEVSAPQLATPQVRSVLHCCLPALFTRGAPNGCCVLMICVVHSL